MTFLQGTFRKVQNLIARLILPNSSLQMGKLDISHEEMLILLARQRERQQASATSMRATWTRDGKPKDENPAQHFVTHDAVLESK